MRILFDSRDLINVVEHARPITVTGLENYLRSRNHTNVLTLTNVRELASPISSGIEFMTIRPLLQALEQLPTTYLAEAKIPGVEIQAAVNAFNAGREYEAPSVYVRRWDYTLLLPPGQRTSATDDWVGLRLDEIIYYIKRSRIDVFAPPSHHLDALRAQLQNDRQSLRLGQAPAREHFSRAFRRHAATHGVILPAGREDELIEWTYSNPDRCPGLRLNHETYRALMANYQDVPETGDFSDLAHVSAVPYVEATTLDRRMRNYCSIAARKMTRLGSTHNYADRLHHDVSALMQHYP
jgi:hypothetical protein